MDVYLGQPPATADPVKDSETGRIKEILHQILKVRWDKAKDIGARGAVLMRERADIQELLNLSEQLSGLQPGTLESLCGKQLAEQITADRRRLEHCAVTAYDKGDICVFPEHIVCDVVYARHIRYDAVVAHKNICPAAYQLCCAFCSRESRILYGICNNCNIHCSIRRVNYYTRRSEHLVSWSACQKRG